MLDYCLVRYVYRPHSQIVNYAFHPLRGLNLHLKENIARNKPSEPILNQISFVSLISKLSIVLSVINQTNQIRISDFIFALFLIMYFSYSNGQVNSENRQDTPIMVHPRAMRSLLT